MRIYWDNFYVIVVDGASTDGTCEEVRRLFPTVRVVRSERELYPAGSRNLGIRNANEACFPSE
ncbi:MAG: glycosyltransferase [Candidatus Jordarchaeales archaeon]